MTNTISMKASALEPGDVVVDYNDTEHTVRRVGGFAGRPLSESHLVCVWFKGEPAFIPFGKSAEVAVRRLAPEAKSYAPAHGGYPGTVVTR